MGKDVGVDFVKKLLGKEIKLDDPKAEEARIAQNEADFEEQILANKIRLRTIKSITNSTIEKAFKDSKLDEFIASEIKFRIAENVKSQARLIVREALEDLDESYDITSSLRSQVISIIKNSFKGRGHHL